MGIFDYSVLAGYLLLLLAIGWHFRACTEREDDFFLAGRKMGFFPIGLSVMVTAFSAINYMALPGEVFGYGLYVLVSLPVFFLAAWFLNRFWLPRLYRRKTVSLYAILEERFDRRVRLLADVIFLVWRIFWMSVALYALSSVMAVLTGIPRLPVLLTAGIVATAYTAMGGMRAVMWTDVLQFFVLLGGILLGVWMALGSEAREWCEILTAAGKFQPFLPFDPHFFSLDPRIRITFLSGLMGTFAAFLARYGADQMVMQRFFAAKNLESARRGMWFNSFAAVFSLLLLAVFGLALYVHAKNSGTLAGVDFSSLPVGTRKALLMREFASLIQRFPTGTGGLISAGLLAATMSSVDSGLNSCCAIFASDFGLRHSGRVGTLLLGVVITLGAWVVAVFLGHTDTLFVLVNKFVASSPEFVGELRFR